MKAIVLNGGGPSVAETPEPAAGPGEVVVRPTFVGASAADVHAQLHGSREATPPAGAGSGLGSELAGVVEALGPGVDGLAVGDRVSVDPRPYCGTCLQCRAGHYSTCEREGGPGSGAGLGALAERVAVRAGNCHPVAPAVTDLQAALVPAVVRATHGIRTAGLGIGDNVGVLGLDDVGLATLQWVRSVTVGTVVAVDPVERRRALAGRLGADLALDPASPDVGAGVLEAVPEGLDSVLVSLTEQLPAEDGLLGLAFTVLRLQGTVVLTQVLGNRAWASLQDAPYLPLQREAAIHNTGGVAHERPLLGGRPGGDWSATLRAFALGRLDVGGLDVHVVPFDEVRTGADLSDALARVPGDASKVVFSMDGGTP